MTASTIRFTGIRAVLFDLDGTLVDSAPDLGAAADALRTRQGLPSLPLEDYRSRAGSGARGMLQVAFGITPDHPEFDGLKEAFFVEYSTCLMQRTRLFPEVDELLAELQSQGLRWGVVTNKAERFSQPIAQALSVFESAATLISGDTTPHAKPHPAPLLEAARRMELLPAQCLYVGDDERDIRAGKAAGMHTVAASYGYLGHEADVRAWGASAEVTSPLQLLKYLELP